MLYALLVEAMNSVTLWEDGVFEFLKLKIINKENSPAISVELQPNRLWTGSKLYIYTEHGADSFGMNHISVDFVPVLLTGRRLDSSTPFAHYVERLIQGDDEPPPFSKEEFAIMKSPKCSFGGLAARLCSASFTFLESEVIRRSSVNIRAAYMWLKHTNWKLYANRNSGAMHKYMLKLCVLHCIVNGQLSPAAISSDDFQDVLNERSLNQCIAVTVQQVWKCIVSDSIPSISSPSSGRLPVWESEPFAEFYAYYIRCFTLPYLTDSFDPPPTELNIDPHKRAPIDNRTQRAKTRANDFTAINRMMIRDRFEVAKTFCSRFARTDQVNDENDSLRIWPLTNTMNPKARRMIRFVMLSDDTMIDNYFRQGSNADTLPSTYLTCGTTDDEHFRRDEFLQDKFDHNVINHSLLQK